jgi:neutral ceramidase
VTVASKAGFGKRDLTPDLGRRIAGYSLCSPNAQGVFGRLEARALVLELEGERIALLGIDLLAGSRWVAQRVAERLGWGLDRVLVAGTHVHAGPSGVFASGYDDVTSKNTGFDDFAATRAVDAAHAAIVDALAALQPARVGFGSAHVVGAAWNRSSRATLWNRVPGEAGFAQDPDPLGAPTPGRERAVATWINGVDPGPLPAIPPWPHEGSSFAEFLASLTTQPLGACVGQNGPLEQAKAAERALAWSEAQVVWAERPTGAPIGAFAIPPGTPAVLGFKYELFGPDVHGFVRSRVPFPVAIGGGVVGDVNVMPPSLSADELRAARKDLDTVLPAIREAAAALAVAIEAAVADAKTRLRADLRVATALRHPTVAGAAFTDPRGTPRKLADEAHVGPETLRGSELAPGAKALPRFGPADAFDPADPQSPKRKWPLSKIDAPTTTRVHLVRFTDAAGAPVAGLLAAGTELSCGLARVLTDALAPQLGRVLLASPAGDYLSYASTPLEYRAQEYETSSVVYGRLTGDWLLTVARGLVGQTGLVGPVPPLVRDPKAPDYDRPGEVPLPSERFERYRGEAGAHGFEVTRMPGGGLRLAGWFTPVSSSPRATITPGTPLFRITDGATTVDEIGAVAVCARIGGSHRRWAFQLELDATGSFPTGAQVRFVWSGASEDRPRSAFPPVTVPATGTARQVSG